MKPLASLLLGPATLQLLLFSLTAVHSSGPTLSCCLKTSKTVLRQDKIKDYYLQRAGLCPVDAVIFVTVKKVKICSSPTSPWVRAAMKHVDRKKKRRPADQGSPRRAKPASLPRKRPPLT